MKRLPLLIYFLLCTIVLPAQDDQALSPIIFIYDASGSMWGQMQGKTKMAIAAKVLSNAVNELPDNQQVGLVAYGHRKKGDCQDVEFLVEANNSDKAVVNQSLKAIKPLGKTPLAYSATQVIDKLRESKGKATIILVTDGIESCNGDICDVVSKAKAEGIDFKLHIIGFGLKEGETEQLSCAAKAGDGQYYDAADAGALGDVIEEATSKTVNKPKENFSIYAIKNNEAVDAWVRAFKAGTDEEVSVTRTYRDTSYVYLPPGKYDLNVKPLEGSKIKGTTVTVESIEGEIGHQTISFDGGTINIMVSNNGEGWDATTKVKSKDGKLVGAGRTYGRLKPIEVNAGVYDIEVMAIRMNGLGVKHTIEDIVVQGNKTVDAIHDFKSGIANLGVEENGTLVDVTVSIMEATTEKVVAGGRSYTRSSSNPREFILNPGSYKVKLRGRKGGKDTIKWFEFTVAQGDNFTKMYEW